MMKNVLLLSALVSCCFTVAAQEHVHGQGQMFISQEDNNWHVQLILPAADVLGFEHAPENEAQQKTIQLFAKRLEDNNSIIELNPNCSLNEVTHSLNLAYLNNIETVHAQKHDEKHHEHGDHNEFLHEDVNVEYRFACPAKVKKLTVTLFKGLVSLTSIRAQWITNISQGLAQLTPAEPDIAW
ncbi:DUF2796 domain-containing protein [Paraglaciecola sp. L1A13]|uniref:ZrgA family zinc uptake protein n=1 Tax=Paraglaciecola sp. L1A13 TaxID=2686359 RepID=UPI00131E01B1|nr:DUF2796 domain-containing protein [Paraglaciecola sp. L1A13]|tara:strand:- start:8797 stop:9345 length:549 start_codon:yes stop_codon:yes gene_type:complete